MPTTIEHSKSCEKHLSKPFTEVHKWLDEYAKMFPIGFFNDYHRSFRHNSYGVECVRSMWGLEAEKAAKLHIVEDLYGINSKKNLKYLLSLYPKSIMIFNKLTNMEPIVHSSVVDTWIKEGFGLVKLATKELVNV